MDTDTHGRKKIEVWVNARDKRDLGHWAKRAGYTVAEVMRRAVEEKIEELKRKVEGT